MKRLDYLLVLAVALSPMTGWRFGKIGPAEIVLLLWCVLAVLNRGGPLRLGGLGRAWAIVMFAMLIGAFHGALRASPMTTPEDLLTWLFLAVASTIVFAVLRDRSPSQVEMLLRTTGAAVTIWFSALYVYSMTISLAFLGAPLWFGESRFAGGGDNPHHLGTLMAAVIFINFRSAYRAGTPMARLIWVGMTAASLYIGMETASSTLLLAVGATAVATGVYVVTERISDRRARTALVVISGVLAVALLALFWQRLLSFFAAFLDSDQNGWGRLELWTSLDDVLGDVLLLGLGPGTFAMDGTMEFHNSYLEFIVMLGVPFFLIAAGFLLAGLSRLASQWSLLTIVLPMLIYSVSGFSMRRVSFWIVLALCLAAADHAVTLMSRRASPMPVGASAATS